MQKILSFFRTVVQQQPLFTKTLNNWPLLLVLPILVGLLWRNPFSERTLIPNFEPFPDSFHYIVPARCLIQHQTFTLCRNEQPGLSPSVPPIYSLVLLPGYVLQSDPRFFYFTNVVLAIGSVIVLYQIAKKLAFPQVITFLVLFSYVTSYHVYWFPTLAMAENVMLFLMFISWHQFLLPKNVKNAAIQGLVLSAIYGSKYASLPLVSLTGLLYFGTLLFEWYHKQTSRKNVIKVSFVLFISFAIPFLILGGIRPLIGLWNAITSILATITQASVGSEAASGVTASTTSSNPWFSTDYFTTHLKFYLEATIGKATNVLWDRRSFFPIWVGVAGWSGLVLGIFRKKYQTISIVLASTTLLQAVALSFFYAADSRYQLQVLAAGYISLGIYLSILHQTFVQLQQSRAIKAFLLILFLGTALFSFQRIKSQLSLNLKYAETPWWYLMVEEMDAYFSDTASDETMLITLGSPYFFDFYSNNKYSLLPLSASQDFIQSANIVWGIDEQKTLLATYEDQLSNGKQVYITNFGVNANSQFTSEFTAVTKHFELEEVQTGCHQLCNIYELKQVKPNTL